MPWSVKKRGSKFCVIKDSDGSSEGCHDSRAKAERQRRALYASEAAAMSIEDLNRVTSEAASRMIAQEEHLAEIYEKAFRHAGRVAAGAIKRDSITAGAFVPPNPPPEGELTEAEQEQVRKIHEQAAEGYWFLVLAPLGLAVATETFLNALLMRATNEFALIAASTVTAIVEQGMAENLSLAEVSSNLQAAFENLAPHTARMLAQTQTTAIANEGALRAAHAVAKTKTVYKTWHTQQDNRVRPAHAASGGQTVPLASPFSVGGYALMYPGDPAGPLSMIANCRCFLSFTDSLAVSASGSTLSGGTMSANTPLILHTPGTVYGTSYTSIPLSGNSFTITVGDQAPAEEQELTPVRWQGVLTLEGCATSDGRYFAADCWEHRDLPLTLMAQLSTQEGHTGAEVAGRIDRIWKQAASEVEGLEDQPEGVTAVMGEGEFTGEFGIQTVAPLVGDETLRGVSVDFAVHERGFWDPETQSFVEPDDEDMMVMMFGGEGKVMPAAIKAEIAMATVVGFPAFAGASISLLASGEETQTVVTTMYGWGIIRDSVLPARPLVASGAPLKPPAEWFEDPHFIGPTPLKVTEDGRVFGHLAEWGMCHIGVRDRCVIAPYSNTGYAFFHTGGLVTEEGEEIRVGKITAGTRHAPLTMSREAVADHYGNSGYVAAFVRAGEDRFGPWLAGCVKSDATPEQIRDLRANPPSGDWREVPGKGLELYAALAVPDPGFPVAALAASGEEDEHMTALIMGFDHDGPVALMPVDEEIGERARIRKIAALTRNL